MSMKISQDRFHSVMSAFYTLTGICVTVFDTQHNVLSYYPFGNCPFCEIMQSFGKSRQSCRESDIRSFEECRAADGPVFHQCHAGLIEATFPLKQANRIYGYIMFGQISSGKPDTAAKERIIRVCGENGISDTGYVLEKYAGVLCKTNDEINAAAVLLEACISFLMQEDVISFQNGAIFGAASEYIDSHLKNDLNADIICESLRIARTKLYDVFASEIGEGVSSYIRRRRMEKAKELLKSTGLPISDIAASVGFSDYNYFSRVFKKQCGISPRSYRSI